MSYVEATAMNVRQRDHDQLNAEVRAFLARGGKIETIPRGVMVDTGPTDVRRLTSMHFDQEKSQARQQAHAQKQPARNSLTQRILTILAKEPQTTLQLYTWFPDTRGQSIRSTLNHMRKRRQIRQKGKGAPWSVV